MSVQTKINKDYVYHTDKRFRYTKHALFQQLIDSTGIIDESVLDKLKLNIRSLLTSIDGDTKDLLDLCLDVIYHDNMKAFGLHQLIMLYIKWEREKGNIEEETEEEA